MINVLVTASAGDVGQGVIKSLNISSYRNQIKLITTDINERSSGLFLGQRGFIVNSAMTETKKYLNQIVEICKKEKIHIAFVVNEHEQQAIALNIDKLNKLVDTYFVVQSLNTIGIARDKLKTYKYLSKKGIRYPESAIGRKNIMSLIKKFDYPIILKPRSGYGSFASFKIINTKSEFESYVSDHGFKNIIGQEYIRDKEDREYTVGVFLDNESKALGVIPMLRRLRFSLTWHAIIKKYPDIEKLAIKAAEAVGAIGPCNVQLRRDMNNQPCVVEINSRISSTTAFRALLGFNEAEASIDYFVKNKKPNLRYKDNMVAMKTWDELIIPYEKYSQLKKTGRVKN
jgi:carbamoyl-phosphate synthase large subunit